MSKFITAATCTLTFALTIACNASTEPVTTGESSSEPNIVQPSAFVVARPTDVES